MVSRSEVYAAIDSEREYQDRLWPEHGGASNPNPLTIGEFLVLLDDYLQKAKSQWTTERKPEVQTLHIMRKIAGIAVNCMEQHGAPKRDQ